MENKKTLVVVSHGSKRKESNQEFREFIEKLNQINSETKKDNELDLLSEKYAEVKGACLEFASPQLETVIEDLIKKGYTRFDILPLFIFAGYHVRQDIPQRLQVLHEKYQELDYQVLEHPAAADDFAGYIFRNALEQSLKRK